MVFKGSFPRLRRLLLVRNKQEIMILLSENNYLLGRDLSINNKTLLNL